MTENEALELIVASVRKVAPHKVGIINTSTDLIADGVLDSLDVMSFLFELERQLGRRLTAIDETFTDFRVSALVTIVKARH